MILKRDFFFIKKHHAWCIGLFIYIKFEGLIYGCMFNSSQMEATRNFWVSRLIVGEDETYSNAFSV